jgi:hypothetical protein
MYVRGQPGGAEGRPWFLDGPKQRSEPRTDVDKGDPFRRGLSLPGRRAHGRVEPNRVWTSSWASRTRPSLETKRNDQWQAGKETLGAMPCASTSCRGGVGGGRTLGLWMVNGGRMTGSAHMLDRQDRAFASWMGSWLLDEGGVVLLFGGLALLLGATGPPQLYRMVGVG